MLESLNLINFRNHIEFDCEFDKITYISGNNGSGKTSILESIYTTLQCKSFKNSKLNQLINFNSDHFRVQISITQQFPSKISYFYDGTRNLLLNSKKVSSISKYLLENPLFVYSPENEGILSINQTSRRKFLDKICFLNNFEHFDLLKNYNKIITLKKSVLKSPNIDKVYFDTLNEQLFIYSTKIQENRSITLDTINKNIKETFELTDKYLEYFQLKYLFSPITDSKNDEEYRRRRILQGAHMDRIKYHLKGMEYEKFSSYGQRKSFSLVCLNACLLTVEEKLKGDIIFLLDDFEAGLDIKRINLFKDLFSKYQLIVTGVSNNHFKDAKTINL